MDGYLLGGSCRCPRKGKISRDQMRREALERANAPTSGEHLHEVMSFAA
jgi:hypothetical protein